MAEDIVSEDGGAKCGSKDATIDKEDEVDTLIEDATTDLAEQTRKQENGSGGQLPPFNSPQQENTKNKVEEDSGEMHEDSYKKQEDSEKKQTDIQIEENSGQMQEDSGQMHEDSQMEEDSGQMQEDSSQMHEDSGQMQEDSGQMQEDSNKMHEDSLMEEDSGKMQEDSGQMQEDSGQIHDTDIVRIPEENTSKLQDKNIGNDRDVLGNDTGQKEDGKIVPSNVQLLNKSEPNTDDDDDVVQVQNYSSDIQIKSVASINSNSIVEISPEQLAREELNKTVTDDTDEMCLIQCKICRKNRREIRGHVRTAHKLTYPDYQQQFGKKQNYTRLTYHRCKLCQVLLVYEFWNFKNHLRREHDMDTVKYCVSFLKQACIKPSSSPPTTTTTTTTTSTPTILKRKQPPTSPQHANKNVITVKSTTLSFSPSLTITPLKSLKPRVEEEAEEGVSDNLADMCKMECRICFLHVGNLPGHLKKVHQECFTLYKKKYREKSLSRFTSISYHRCKLCHEIVQFDLLTLRGHLEKKHNTKYNQYAGLYLKKGNDTKESKKKSALLRPVDPVGRAINGKVGGAMNGHHEEPEIVDITPDIQVIEDPTAEEEGDAMDADGWSRNGWTEDQDQWSTEQDWSGQLGEEEEPWALDSVADPANMMFSDNPEDMCLTQCQICGTELKPKSLGNHLINQHASNLRSYKQQFGQDLVYTKVFWHRCKLCMKIVMFESKTLCYHLSSAHKLTFTDYKDNYLLPIILGNSSGFSEPVRKATLSSKSTKSSPSPSYKNNSNFATFKNHFAPFKVDATPPPVVNIDEPEDDDIAADVSADVEAPAELLNMEVTEHPAHESLTEQSQSIADDDIVEPEPADLALPATQNSHVEKDGAEAENLGSQSGENSLIIDEGEAQLTNGEAPSASEEINEDDIIITDNFNEGSTCLCQLCQREFPVDSFRSHLKNWHGGLKAVDYKVRFGDIVYVRKTYIKCKLCELVILFEYNKVNSHLMNKHMMTFVEYKRQYGGESTTLEPKLKKSRLYKRVENSVYPFPDPPQLQMMPGMPLSDDMGNLSPFHLNQLMAHATGHDGRAGDFVQHDDDDDDGYFEAGNFVKTELHEVEQIFVE